MYYSTLKAILLSSMLLPILSLEYRLIKVQTPEEANGTEFFSLDFTGLIKHYNNDQLNYKAEVHYATTEDGYILTLHRVLSNFARQTSSDKRRVVFVQHALGSSSDQFVGLGPEKSFGLLLSDMGYDVWFGNVRGNVYSRRHRTLSPEDSKFWNFSLDEISSKDLPAMIDYVLNTTGQSSLTYVGHSMGTTLLFMLLSEKMEYNYKIDLAILLTPVYYWTYDNLGKSLCKLITYVMRNFYPDGVVEFLPLNTVFPLYFKRNCRRNNFTVELCFAVLDALTGYSREQISTETTANIFNYFPAGVSLKILYHYIQMYEHARFQHYDYKDEKIHLQLYGQTQPLEYNVTNINVPMAMFFGGYDPLSTVQDIQEFIKRLPNNASVIMKVVKEFNHLAFICGKDVKRLFYKPLIEILNHFHQVNYTEYNKIP